MQFDLSGSLPLKHFQELNAGEGKPIYFGTPFAGASQNLASDIKLNQKVLIDSNIMSDIRNGSNEKNIALMMLNGAILDAEMSHIFSSAELYVSHENPDSLLTKYYRSINDKYLACIDTQEQNQFKDIVFNHKAQIKQNIMIIRDWLVIAKYVYHRKQTNLDKIAKELAEIIKYNNLPILSFAHLIILLFSYVKNNKSRFDNKVFSKIQSDMEYRSTYDEEIKSLYNFAKDITIFLFAPQIFFYQNDEGQPNCDYSWIASSDITVGLILREICIYKITTRQSISNDGQKFLLNIPEVGFRESGTSFEVLNELVDSYPPESIETNLIRSESMILKKNMLPLFAKNLLRVNYGECQMEKT